MRKKKIIFYVLLILSLILLIILSIISANEIKKKVISNKCMQNIYNFETYSPFSINKIVYFSSANCTTNINPNSSFNISNLHQYTDIAIFINNNADGNFTAKNTLKSVILSNINFSLSPSIGTPNLYFKNLNDFASNHYNENTKIEDKIEFKTSSEDTIDYSSPVLFNNCANPMTLSYVNSNLISDYTLGDNISNISYDGSLLKNCNITLNSIACKISFLVTIVNNLDEIYECPMTLSIPLSTESSTIYDGSLILNSDLDYKFIKIKK